MRLLALAAKAPAPRLPPLRNLTVRAVIAVAVVVVAVVLFITPGSNDDSPLAAPAPPTTAVGSTPLPGPLDRALQNLEEAGKS